MEQKRSTIVSMTPNTSSQSWDSMDVEFANGDKGNQLIGKKGENKTSWFKGGDEVDYTIEQNGSYAPKIKIARPPQGGGGGGKPQRPDNTAGMAVGSAINNAVSLVCYGKVELKDLKATAQRIIDIGIQLKEENKAKFQ